MKTLLTALVLPAALVGVQAHAASASSYAGALASIDDIVVSTTGSATFDYNFFDWFIADTIVNDTNDFYASDYYEDASEGGAFISSNLASSYAEAESYSGFLPYSIALADNAGSAYANSFGDLGFAVDGSGEVTVTFDISYAIDIEALSGDEYAEFGINVWDSFGGDDLSFGSFDGFSGDVFLTDFDTLSLTFMVDGYEEGSISMSTWAFADTGVAPVPVPAAAWLFGSALLGLAGIKRRKKAA